MKEQTYIRLRKLKAWGNSLCFYFCRIFPIKSNLVAVCTFEGKGGFGCNPKYIVQELHKKDPSIQFVWFVNDMEKEFPAYIKKVPNTTWNRAYWMSRAKVWIDNYRTRYGTKKRKGQYYLNTWHGMVGFKNSGMWRGEAFSKMAYLVSKADSDMVDMFLADSLWMEEIARKGLVYEGEYLRAGSPRCDCLYGDLTKQREEFREKRGLSQDNKLVMYAPTYREREKGGVRGVFRKESNLDLKRLTHTLEQKFGGKWGVVLRQHPQLSDHIPDSKRDEGGSIKILDESTADDMYEVLPAVDAFVTDYSTAAFDAALSGIPVFLYADDIERFVKDRGGLQWEVYIDTEVHMRSRRDETPSIDTELPFSLARDNQELETQILKFDVGHYQDRLEAFHREIELVFDGMAAKRVVEKIEEEREGNI